MAPEKTCEGHVYVLTSPICEYVKIGGTDHAPLKRIKEINCCEPYRSLGPWSLHDFRQVTDWRKIESALHYSFRSSQVKSVPGQKELFSISPVEASHHLRQIDERMVIRKPKIDRMFQDQEFSFFLESLFRFSGILNWIEIQGAWTFSLFPTTNGGRYYTINIGSHEVAFSSLPSSGASSTHMIVMDRLIHDFQDVSKWLKFRNGRIKHDQYASGLQRATSIFFEGGFDTAIEFLSLKGVRRAIIAYWTEALIELQERECSSIHARHHNWNAIAELKNRMSTKSNFSEISTHNIQHIK